VTHRINLADRSIHGALVANIARNRRRLEVDSVRAARVDEWTMPGSGKRSDDGLSEIAGAAGDEYVHGRFCAEVALRQCYMLLC
jgi:hypothetical protein